MKMKEKKLKKVAKKPKRINFLLKEKINFNIY